MGAQRSDASLKGNANFFECVQVVLHHERNALGFPRAICSLLRKEMDLLSYQRTIFGYHGCDSRVPHFVRP